MSVLETILYSSISIDLIFAILFVWFSSMYILRTNQLLLFTPFVFLGILAALKAGFTFYRLFLETAWLVVELTTFGILVAILVLVLTYGRTVR